MTTIKPTLSTMHMNPSRVTMFGASHSGNSSTKAFHCVYSQLCPLCTSQSTPSRTARGAAGREAGQEAAYIWPEDVIGYRRLVDGRVLIRLEVDERIVRDALGDRLSCSGRREQCQQHRPRRQRTRLAPTTERRRSGPIQGHGKGGGGVLRTALVRCHWRRSWSGYDETFARCDNRTSPLWTKDRQRGSGRQTGCAKREGEEVELDMGCWFEVGAVFGGIKKEGEKIKNRKKNNYGSAVRAGRQPERGRSELSAATGSRLSVSVNRACV